MANTQIVCTIGPSCEDKTTLIKLIKAGADIFRLNFSHGTHEEKSEILDKLEGLRKNDGLEFQILADLQGPKIRVGKIPQGQIHLNDGQRFILTIEENVATQEEISVDYRGLVEDVTVGSIILADDGKLKFEVTEKTENQLICKVLVGGLLKSRKGINIPGVTLGLPALTEKDKEDLKFVLGREFDWIALSFVRTDQDVDMVKQIISQQEPVSSLKIIAKIETREALKNLDKIMTTADGIMIARGDLAIEVPLELVPIAQKVILQNALSRGLFTITATQMLESMIQNISPTRAEISDVANAVVDGTSAVMLSAESAAGKYPVETVSVMESILTRTEKALLDGRISIEDLELY